MNADQKYLVEMVSKYIGWGKNSAIDIRTAFEPAGHPSADDVAALRYAVEKGHSEVAVRALGLSILIREALGHGNLDMSGGVYVAKLFLFILTGEEAEYVQKNPRIEPNDYLMSESLDATGRRKASYVHQDVRDALNRVAEYLVPVFAKGFPLESKATMWGMTPMTPEAREVLVWTRRRLLKLAPLLAGAEDPPRPV